MQQQGLAVTVSGITTQIEEPGQTLVLPAPESSSDASSIIAAVVSSLGSLVALFAVVCLALRIAKRKKRKIKPLSLPVTYETKSNTNGPAQKLEPSRSPKPHTSKTDMGAGTRKKQQPLINSWSLDPSAAPVVCAAESRVSKLSNFCPCA
jgi:hypothetical protein